MRMWSDLIELIQLKKVCNEAKQIRENAGGDYADVQQIEHDRMLL